MRWGLLIFVHGQKHACSTFLALIFLTSNPFCFVDFFTNTGSNTHHLTVCMHQNMD